MTEAVATLEVPDPTREEVIEYYETRRMATVISRFDTEAYSFLYMYQPTPHGTNEFLLLVRADGSYYDYAQDFKSVSYWGTKNFTNVVIDETNEKVSFHYDRDYVIDLKTGVMAVA